MMKLVILLWAISEYKPEYDLKGRVVINDISIITVSQVENFQMVDVIGFNV